MNHSFSILSAIIKQRRSIKPAQMNGNIIPDEQIRELLSLANWAPNHGNTQPWSFVVYGGEAVKRFCKDHADLYKKNTPDEKFMQGNYDKLLHNGDTVSHIIIAIVQRGNLPKIPTLEEYAAASAAVQNILLGAASLGIASLWSTGGMTHSQAMKEYFSLRNDDVILGQIFLGYTNAEAIGKRVVSIDDKVKWHQ